MRLLIVDAYPKHTETLKRVLEQNFFIVDCHSQAVDRSFVTDLGNYNLLIIDADIPPVGAQNLCRQLREEKREFPILIIGSSDEPEDIASFLNAGADDYLKRPFPLVETVARIRALLRRPPVQRKRSVRIGDLRVDISARIAYRGKKELHLTRMEYILLEFLAEREGQIVAKTDLIEHLWGQDAEVSPNAVETHISTLRRKIDTHRKVPLLRNVPGRGYRLD